MCKDDIDQEGNLVKWALEKAERNMLAKGIINQKRLTISKVRFSEVLQKSYNSFVELKNKTIGIEDEDFSKIIEHLFFSSREISTRSIEGIKCLGYEYTFERAKVGYTLYNLREERSEKLTSVENLILRYDPKRNLHNYLIGAILNYIKSFKNSTIQKRSNHISKDALLSDESGSTLEDTLLQSYDGSQEGVEYSQEVRELVNRAYLYFKEDLEVVIDKELFYTIYEWVGEKGLFLSDVKILLEDHSELTDTIWNYLEEVALEIAQENNFNIDKDLIGIKTSKKIKKANKRTLVKQVISGKEDKRKYTKLRREVRKTNKVLVCT